MNITDLIKAIRSKIQSNTDLKCYDVVAENTESPFVYIELVSTEPADTKTMFVQAYNISIHIISEPTNSHVPIYKAIEEVTEALTEEVDLEEPYNLINQMYKGVQSIYTEETNERHAILSYTFKICYGLKIK